MNVDMNKIVRVYSGRPGCGCGCRGNYYTDQRNITRVVNAINRSLAIGEEDGVCKGNADGIAFVETDKRYYWAYETKE